MKRHTSLIVGLAFAGASIASVASAFQAPNVTLVAPATGTGGGIAVLRGNYQFMGCTGILPFPRNGFDAITGLPDLAGGTLPFFLREANTIPFAYFSNYGRNPCAPSSGS